LEKTVVVQGFIRSPYGFGKFFAVGSDRETTSYIAVENILLLE
jgi:hypothetical protein